MRVSNSSGTVGGQYETQRLVRSFDGECAGHLGTGHILHGERDSGAHGKLRLSNLIVCGGLFQV